MHPSRPAIRAAAVAAALASSSPPAARARGASPSAGAVTPAPSTRSARPRRRPPRSRSPSASASSRASSSPSSTSPSRAGPTTPPGLDVTLQNKIDPDLITLLGQGAVDIGSGDGTSVIPAVSQGIPVVYTSTIYGQFPAVVVAKAESGIKTAADLEDKKIGIPGKYGSSWIMLQALLGSAGLTPADVEIVEFPDFGQAAALQQGAVDAATGLREQRADPAQEGRHRAGRADRRRHRAAAGPRPRDRQGDARGEARRPRRVHGGHARGDGPDRRGPPEGPRRHVRRGAGPRR